MKNKGLFIVLAAIGVFAIIGTAIAAGVYWGNRNFQRGWFGHGQWRSTPMMGTGIWRGGSQPWTGRSSQILTIEEAEDAILEYIADYGSNEELHIGEIMIFDNHAYAQVVEEDSGIGAFEVLVDPDTLYVRLEMGPNMMWNLKYSQMRGGMMGGANYGDGVDMPISGDEAVDIASKYLGSNNSNLSVDDHPDTFYGYYTMHTTIDDEVVGMLSVNGYSGQIIIHTWHGDFIEMSEHT